MAKIVNMHEAKTHFSRLAESVESGEEVIIARAGKPFMKLVAYSPQRSTFGLLETEFSNIDADALMGIDPDIQRMFYGDDWESMNATA